MNITTTCPDRKAMAKALAEHLGCDCVYLFTPTYAFRVGNLQVERNGSITGERADLEAAADWLLENGYIQEPLPQPEAADEEQEAPAEEQHEEEQIDEEQESEPDEDLEAPHEQAITNTCLTLPLSEFEPHDLINFLRMLYARQRLICEMVQSHDIVLTEDVLTALQGPDLNTMDDVKRVIQDCIKQGFLKGIDLVENKISLAFPYSEEQPTRWMHYAVLLTAIAKKAKKAVRVNTARVKPADDEMKYFCRGFLLQLGLGGAEYKELRHVLLNHLHGYAAFRTADKMQAHQQKYADLRRQYRESNSEAHSEVNEHEED